MRYVNVVDIEPLAFLLRGKKDIVMAEIGMFKGQSTQLILDNFDVKKYIAIDPFENYDEYHEESIEPHLSEDLYSEMLKKFSEYPNIYIKKDYAHNVVNNIKDQSLDVCYIDGNHAYKYVLQDIIDWFPKIKEGGILMGDDIVVKDVRKALHAYFGDLTYDLWMGKRGWFVMKENMFGNKNWYGERYNWCPKE